MNIQPEDGISPLFMPKSRKPEKRGPRPFRYGVLVPDSDLRIDDPGLRDTRPRK
jgi:hypothetical protein